MEINFNLKKHVIFVSLLFLIANISIFLDIPLLRQAAVFIYLTFIPGYLFLRAIKMDDLPKIEYFLYSIGISLTILMLSGFLMNFIFPIFNIVNPISEFNLLMVTNLLTVILFILSFKNKNYPSLKLNYSSGQYNQVLLLLFIPLIAISGAELSFFYGFRALIFTVIILISLTPLLVVFNKISRELYPFLILIISISLLYHWSLISNYLVGADIQYEYYYSNLVYQASLWNPEFASNLNGILSITMLAPIYSKLMDFSLIWIYKLIYPLIYSLVPLGLYLVIQNQLKNKKMAFLSVFYFMSVFPFFSELLQTGRQEIAEFFLVLLLLLLVTRKMDTVKGSLLVILFSFSVVVSHYGITLMYSYLLIMGVCILPLIKYIVDKVGLKKNISFKSLRNRKISYTYVLFFLVLAISWYLYVSSSNMVITLWTIFSNINNNLFTSLFSSAASQGLSLIVKSSFNMTQAIYKYLYLLSQAFIGLGVLFFIINRKLRSEYHFNPDYLMFSVSSLLVLILALVLPYFDSSFNTTRLYHVTLFFLAPFVVIGLSEILKIINRAVKNPIKDTGKLCAGLFSLFLLVFLLFNTGLMIEVSNSLGSNIEPFSIALGDASSISPLYTPADVNAAYWIRDHSTTTTTIYADHLALDIFNGFLMKTGYKDIQNVTSGNEYYIYLREVNINNNVIFSLIKRNVGTPENVKINLTNLDQNASVIYNDGTKILFVG